MKKKPKKESMKGMSSYLVAIGIAVLVLLIVSGGQLNQQFSSSASLAATAGPITCPSGQTPITVYDAQECGTTLQKTNTGTAGICLSYTCPTSIQGETVAYCKVAVKNYVSGGYETQKERLLAGSSKNYPDYCSQDPNGQKYVIERDIYRNRINSCEICVGDIQQNECDPGSVICGSGGEIKTCTIGNTQKPYYHYEIYDSCPSGSTCLNTINGVKCSQPCTNDLQCQRWQYCDTSIRSCEMQKADEQSCDRDEQCLSDACVDNLFGKTCRTVTGKSPGTCPIENIKTSGDCLACGGKWKDEQGLLGRGWAGLFGGEMRAPECEFDSGIDLSKLQTIIIGSLLLSLILAVLILVLGLVIRPLGIILRGLYNVMAFLKLITIMALLFMLLFTGLTLQTAALFGM